MLVRLPAGVGADGRHRHAAYDALHGLRARRAGSGAGHFLIGGGGRLRSASRLTPRQMWMLSPWSAERRWPAWRRPRAESEGQHNAWPDVQLYSNACEVKPVGAVPDREMPLKRRECLERELRSSTGPPPRRRWPRRISVYEDARSLAEPSCAQGDRDIDETRWCGRRRDDAAAAAQAAGWGHRAVRARDHLGVLRRRGEEYRGRDRKPSDSLHHLKYSALLRGGRLNRCESSRSHPSPTAGRIVRAGKSWPMLGPGVVWPSVVYSGHRDAPTLGANNRIRSPQMAESAVSLLTG